MKKVFCGLLAFAMVLTALAGVPFRAYALSVPAVSAESASAVVGEEVEVDVSIANNPGLIALKVEVRFDAALTLTAVENTGLLGDDFMSGDVMTSPYVFYWESALSPSDYEGNGVIATLSFTADSVPGDGFADVQVSVIEAYDYGLQKYTFTTVNGGVTVSEAPAQYTVTFNANGGSVSTVSKTVTAGGTYGELPVPTRSGYRFTGWYTAATGGTQIMAGDTVEITSSTSLYARWRINGDINGDGFVNAKDNAILSAAFGSRASNPSSGYNASADINGDGFINAKDRAILIANFGKRG